MATSTLTKVIHIYPDSFSIHHYSQATYFIIQSDPINCDGIEVCHLAWLVLDHPELIRNSQVYGTCSNGTNFKDLIPGGFEICPV